jgi:sulfite reductase alpha subunit-like flavoprotein
MINYLRIGILLYQIDILIHRFEIVKENVKEKIFLSHITKKWNPTEEHSESNTYEAKVKSNKRITSTDWEQDVRHVVIDIESSGIKYVK